jgi:TRAP transporter 4TM/12TM fusion protein
LARDSVAAVMDTKKAREIISAGLCGFLIYYGLVPFVGRIQFTIIFYSVITVITLLYCMGEKRKPFIPFVKSRWVNFFVLWLYLVLGTFQAVYYYVNFAELSYLSLGEYTLLEYALAVINLWICFHITWYVTGLSLPLVGFVCILYAIFGFVFPGPFYHSGLRFTEMLEYFSLLMIEGGIYGVPLQVGATLVAIFVFFAMLAQASGLLQTFLKISWRVAKRTAKALPQFAVLSSMAFSTITGAAMANTAATGSFTIPLMKRYGIRPHVAGAVESVASTGGQYMPPVMGAVAFLMVEYLGVHYLEIMKAGLPLALILYAGIIIAVHLTAGREVRFAGNVGEEEETKEYAAPLSRNDWLHLVSFGCAVVGLTLGYAVLDLSVMYGALIAIFTYLGIELADAVVMGFRGEGVRPFVRWLKRLYEGCSRTTEALITLVFLVALVGLIIKVLYATGASQVLGMYMLELSGGRLIPLILLAAVLCIFLGMVSVSVTAYILVAIMVAPVLIKFGIGPYVSHFFVFMLSVTSPLTPPIGGGVIVASVLSGANVFKVGWQSVKMGIIYFFMPFVLIVHPEILHFNRGTMVAFPLLVVSTCGIVLAVNMKSAKVPDHLLRVVLLMAGVASSLTPYARGFFLGLSLMVLVLATSALLYRNWETIK